jgi:hypothetical protein
MLFSRYNVAYEKERKIMRNVASVAELTRSFFAEIDKSRLTLVFYRRRAFEHELIGGAVLWGAFDKKGLKVAGGGCAGGRILWFGFAVVYSWRNAIIGSTRAALKAGT